MMTTLSPSASKAFLRNFYFLVAGKTISDIGNYLDMVALNLYVYALTGSAFKMGIFMAIRLLGGFLSGFYSGILADRMNRKVLMIFSDIVRSIVLLALVFSPEDWQIPLLYTVAFVLGSFSSLFNVSFQSSIPVIVAEGYLVKANALLTSYQSVAMVIGLVTAGTILGFLSYESIFMIDAVTYFISAVNLIWLPIKTSENQTASHSKMSFFKELGATYIYLRTLPVLMGLMAIRFMDTFGSAAHNVGMPVFSSLMNPDHPSLYMGLIWAIWSVGNLAGSRGMVRWFKSNSEAHNELAFGISTFFMSAFFILVFWENPLYLILLFAFFAGISDGISSICFNSRLQKAPDDKRGRVFGISSTLQTVGFGIGMVICSPLFDHFKPIIVVGLLHGIPMLMTLGFTLKYFGKWRASLQQMADRKETVNL